MPFLYLHRAQITLRHEPQSEISAVSGGGKTRGRTFPGRRLEFTTLGRSSRGWPARRGRRRVRRAGAAAGWYGGGRGGCGWCRVPKAPVCIPAGAGGGAPGDGRRECKLLGRRECLHSQSHCVRGLKSLCSTFGAAEGRPSLRPGTFEKAGCGEAAPSLFESFRPESAMNLFDTSAITIAGVPPQRSILVFSRS